MFKNKYTLIFILMMDVLFIYLLVPNIIFYLSPPNAIFWVASIIEIGLAFLTARMTYNQKNTRLIKFGLLLGFIAFVLPFVLVIFGSTFFRPVGPSYMIYGLVLCTLSLYQAIKDRNKKDIKVENTEALSKGGVLSILIFAGIFVFAALLFGLIIGLMTCSK